MQEAQIVIVGAGASGLSTAAALKRRGLSAIVLDRDAEVGGSWRRRYDRLHLHTIRRFSGLAHMGIPPNYPRYLSRDMFAHYLESYKEHLGIEVLQNTEVGAIRASGANNGAAKFIIETGAGEWAAQTVVIATGMYGDPVVPKFPGLDTYRGLWLHSSGYTTGRKFAGRRVLVVGIGNTGAEIAADLVEQGAQAVAISIRTMPPIVPRDFLATPVQLFGIALSRAPAALADRVGAVLGRIALGDLGAYGLRAPQWLPFSARRIPVIDAGFVSHLKRGRIAIRPDIAHFTESGIMFSGGRYEEYDVVILATGYRTGLMKVLDFPDLLDETGYPKFVSGGRTAQPGLYFMGFFESHRGLLFETSLASRRLARVIAADLAPG